MPEPLSASGPLEGLEDIRWESLETAYGDARAVPEILSKLASRDPAFVDEGYTEIYDLGLVHQLTVYSATAAAMPFIGRIAASQGSHRRPRLISVLADTSLGKDVPYSPAGTTAAVRQAIRDILPLLRPLIDADDRAMQMALADLAAALPFDFADAQPLVIGLFHQETAPTTRAALAGALALLGDQSAHVIDLLMEAEQRSIHKVLRRGKSVYVTAELAAGKDVPGAEDIVGLPVHAEVIAWATKSPPVTEDDRFLQAARSVHELFMRDPVYNEVTYRAP